MANHTQKFVTSEAALRAIIGSPSELVCSKIADRCNALTAQFVAASPLVLVATYDLAGRCDVSPRGDAPGFVRLLDEQTLLIPERPGNRIADTLVNLLQQPRIALLFLIPGVDDSFRVNGRAAITDDSELLANSVHEGRAPKLGIMVQIEEAFTHCAKAFIRGDLWNPAKFRARSELPSSGQIMKALRSQDPSFDAEAYDAERAARYARREGFY